MSNTSVTPTYKFVSRSFTVGTTQNFETLDLLEKGVVRMSETVFDKSDTPTDAVVTGAAVFIQDFNISFSGGAHHQVDRFKLAPSATVNEDGSVTTAVDLILNNNEDHRVSTNSSVTLLTVIQLVPASHQDNTAATPNSFLVIMDEVTPTEAANGVLSYTLTEVGTCVEATDYQTAVTGWELRSDNGKTYKFTDFEFSPTAAQYAASNTPPIWFATPYINAGSGSDNHSFKGTGIFTAIGTNDPGSSSNPGAIGVQTSTYRANGGKDEIKFGANVKSAYAVMKNLYNRGNDGASNSLSAFTCSGVTVSLDTKASPNVEVDWGRHEAKWKGAMAASWDSSIDYLIIAELDV